MPAERYYTSADLMIGCEIILDKGEHHHLVHVMRVKVGDLVEIVNGKGFLAQGEVATLTKREAVITIRSVLFEEPKVKKIVLFQAIPRMNRLDTIIEKCTELGMTEMVLWASDLSERKKFTPDQLERLQSVAISAMKQCGRLYLPIILFDKDPKFEMELLFFGDLEPKAPRLIDLHIDNSCGYIIGPESGLSVNEINRFRKLGAIGTNLHENVLRTDTAAITAMAIISSKIMDE